MYTKEVNQMIYDAEKYRNSWVKASNDSEFFTFSSALNLFLKSKKERISC